MDLKINNLADFLCFGTRGSEVQILSPRPFVILGPFEDQVEWLSVGGPETYAHREHREGDALNGRFVPYRALYNR